MRRARSALLLLALLPVPGLAHAQDGLQRASVALLDASLEATAGLEPGGLAVRVTRELDGAPDADGLATVLVTPSLEALGADERFTRVHLAGFGRDGASPARVAGNLGYAGLLDLILRREGESLVIAGEAFRTADEASVGTFVHRVPLDASLRRYLGFPPLLADDAVTARRIAIPGNGYVALAVGDLDGDGRAEIVASRPGEVHVFRLDGRRLRIVGRAPILPSTPRSPSPPRRIVGTARIDGDAVHLRISEHAVGLTLRLVDGVPRVAVEAGPCEADRFPMMGGCAQLVTGRDFFDPELTHPAAPDPEAPAHFYTYAYARYEARDGSPASYEAIVMPSGRLSIRTRVERPREGRAPEIVERGSAAVGYGTALAMSDLDLDGTAELLVSHGVVAGSGDQISLLRVLPRGTLRVMWRSEPMGGSVWLASAGDVDGDGATELVAIEEPANGHGRATLWLVR
ncbi:MAG: hypothetical protein KC619_03040 [Myxococcales bacterium]|nr:hypothetical protein [Myxococcales bacterium]